MIAGPPSALQMFIRRLLDARENRKWKEAEAARYMPVDGGRLDAETERRALPPPCAEWQTALAPPSSPPVDILSLPDRDKARTVVPDYDHIEYE